MRVMVFGKATEESEKGAPPTMEAFEAMERFNESTVSVANLLLLSKPVPLVTAP